MSENLSDIPLKTTTKNKESNFSKFQFDGYDAQKYGTNEAVMLYNIRYWVRHNKANDKHCYDGRYWTYNSARAFGEIFFFLTSDQIRRVLERLVAAGILCVGNFNKFRADRTLWYSVNEDWALSSGQEESATIWQKCQMQMANLPNGFGKNAKCDLAKMPNGFGKFAKPIPDINIHIENQDNKLTDNTYMSSLDLRDVKNDQSIDETDKGSLPLKKKQKAKSPELVTPQHEILELWNRVNSEHNKLLPKAIALNRGRIAHIKEASIAYFKDMGEWEAYFHGLYDSDFLLGLSGGSWKASFEWAVNPNNIVKVLEGKYFKSKVQRYSAAQINNARTLQNNPYTERAKEERGE